MRVAIVINTAWNIYNFRMGLVRALLAEGMQVVAIAPSDGYEKELKRNGCEFVSVPMEKTGTNPWKEFKIILRLYRAYKKAKPDIILHFTIKPNTYGSIAAKWLGIPIINNVSGLGTVFLNSGLVSKIALAVYRYTFRYPNKVFFQNEFDRELFLNKGLVAREVTEVIPGSGIDLKKFIASPKEQNGNTFTFLMISRLLVDKGVYDFIEAIKSLKEKRPELHFQLLGPVDPEHKRGISNEELQEWIDEEWVEYLGTTDDVRPFISNADCIVLPSYREGTPKTLLEAASMQKPLIATDVPGCNSIVVNNYNGYLCNLKDPIDLAKKMNKMADLDSVQITEFGKNSRKKVEDDFDEKIVVSKYLKSINKIANIGNEI